MAGMTVEDALAYLKTISTSTGDDAFTHISEIVRSVLQAKAKNAVDILETSFLLKKTRFVSHEGDKPVKRGRDPSDVKPVKQFFSLFCQKEPEPAVKEEPKKEDEGEEEEVPAEEPEEPPVNEFEAQNMLMDSVFFDACGCGIGRLDTYLVILALKQLGDDPTFGIETVRFFGKFLGISNNYYVFESTLKEGANGDVEEDVEEGEDGEEGEEKPKKTKNWGRPIDGIPPEEGVGTNAMVYWYCHRPGDACKKLPPVTPLQLKTARQLKKYLTGDPEAEVSGYPPFPGIELNYLRAQIARIAHGTQIAPAGSYSASEDDGGEQTVTPAEDFTMPPTEQLEALEKWVHKNAMISKQGRCTKYEEPESEGEEQPEADGEEAVEDEEGKDAEEAQDEEEEEEEAEQEEKPQEEEQPGPLRPISEDKDLLGMEGVKAWSVCKSSSIKGLKHQVICLRSHLWPGAYCVATPTSFSNVYVGYGIKNEPFKPSMPPPVQKEYRKQMVEATDLPPKPDPPPAEDEDEDEGEGDEAGDGEEGDDEEEY